MFLSARLGRAFVFDYLLRLVEYRLVDTLERLLGLQQIVLVKELSALVAQTVEFPRLVLPVFAIGERSLFDNEEVSLLPSSPFSLATVVCLSQSALQSLGKFSPVLSHQVSTKDNNQ